MERSVALLGRTLATVGLEQRRLLVSDVRRKRSWEVRLWAREAQVGGKRVVVLGA
jgi:hypothetical protein